MASKPDPMPRGVVPPGRYAKGGRSPIVYVMLCPPCAGYAPITDPGYDGALSGRCQGCGADSRELHRFQAVIMSAVPGGCMCVTAHGRVTGDLPTEAETRAVMTEVRTRPARFRSKDDAALAALEADGAGNPVGQTSPSGEDERP